MSETSYNTKNPAVKRILQEMREMEKDDSLDFVAEACEENIFEWYFVVRGPPGTDFEGGLYHGRILLPVEYPFKPPSFTMFTKNGRFETLTKICLSISDHHPEHWQPSWSVRTALTALVAFFPTAGKGAIGSQDLSPETRKQLAINSRKEIVNHSNTEKQKLATKLHEKLLKRIEKSIGEKIGTKSTNNANSQEANTEEVQEFESPIRLEQDAHSNWLWGSLTYILGFLIIAIIFKKIFA